MRRQLPASPFVLAAGTTSDGVGTSTGATALTVCTVFLERNGAFMVRVWIVLRAVVVFFAGFAESFSGTAFASLEDSFVIFLGM
jgi:hypothetical protein